MRIPLILALMWFAAPARASLCNASERYCGYLHGSSSSSSPAAPSRDNTVRLNPSSVPLEKGFGLGFIVFDGVDAGLVKGLGRVGAAISPSNSEETFFGPPGLEHPQDYLERKLNTKKYPSQKVTLATAVGLWKSKSSGLRRFELNLGVMGKYNRFTHAVTPGGGLSGILGPLTFGYSVYSDQTQLDDGLNLPTSKTVTKYRVETYSGGIFLTSLAVDYSVLRLIADDDVSTTSVLTGSLFLKNCMFTAASRREDSSRPAFDPQTRTLVVQPIKNEVFGGVQYNMWKDIMLGVFYNYYLLHELSVGATFFL